MMRGRRLRDRRQRNKFTRTESTHARTHTHERDDKGNNHNNMHVVFYINQNTHTLIMAPVLLAHVNTTNKKQTNDHKTTSGETLSRSRSR